MIYLLLQLHENIRTFHLYKKANQSFTDHQFPIEQLSQVITTFKKIQAQSPVTHIVVLYGMRRFSLVRQATLFSNLVAYFYDISLSSLIVSENAHQEEIRQALKTKKLQWTSHIVPKYMMKPNITQRKSHDKKTR